MGLLALLGSHLHKQRTEGGWMKKKTVDLANIVDTARSLCCEVERGEHQLLLASKRTSVWLTSYFPFSLLKRTLSVL